MVAQKINVVLVLRLMTKVTTHVYNNKQTFNTNIYNNNTGTILVIIIIITACYQLPYNSHC